MSYIDDLYKQQANKKPNPYYIGSAEEFCKRIGLRGAVMKAIEKNLNTRHFAGYYRRYTEPYGDSVYEIVPDIATVNSYFYEDSSLRLTGDIYKDTEFYVSFGAEYGERNPGDGGEPKDTGLKNMDWERVRVLLARQIQDLGLKSYEIKIVHMAVQTKIRKRYNSDIFNRPRYFYVPNRHHYIWVSASW